MNAAALPALKTLFHASPMGVSFSVSRVFREVNDRFCAISGYTRDELIGQPTRLLYASEEDYAAAGEALLARQPQAQLDVQMRRKDGRIIDLALHITALRPGDPESGIIASVLDATPYRRAQALLRLRAEISDAVGHGDREALSTAALSEALSATRSSVALLQLPALDADTPWLDADARCGADGRVDCSLGGADAGTGQAARDSLLGLCRRQSMAAVETRRPVGLPQGAAASTDNPLAVPLLRGGTVAAVLTVAGAAAVYEDDDAELLSEIASMAADGVNALRDRAALRDSEARAALASDVAGIGVWDWNIASGRVSVNQAYLRMLGMGAGPLVIDINQWQGLIHPDDRGRIAAEGEAALAADTQFQTEYRLRTTGGDWCHVLSRGRVFERDAQGRPLRMIGTHTDITALRRTEADLGTARARLNMALEGGNLGLYEVNLVKGAPELSVDARYLAQIGLTEADGAFTLARWLGLLHPEDRGRLKQCIDDYDHGVSDGMEVEYRLRHADGSWRWILDRSRVFERTPDGRVQRSAGAHVDVTVLRRTEADLQATRDWLELAVEGGELGLYEINVADGTKRLAVDDRYLAQLGLTQADGPLTVARWFELLYPDDHAHMERLIADLDAGRADNWHAEYRLRHADGSWRWILDRARVFVRTTDGKILRAAGAHLDITERKAAEEALADLNRTLEDRVAAQTAALRRQAEQLRALASQLSRTEQRERKRLATILHDHIQQLIVAAQMQVGQLARAADGSRLRAPAEAASQVLKEALEASRSLTVELSPPVLRDAGLIGGLNWLATRMRERHGLAVRLRADTATEPADDEVRFLLFECARELLLNVSKHAGVTQAEMTLLRCAPGEIRLIVSDTGQGFDPAVLQHIEPQAMTFGLFSIRERLAYIGGRMDIESAPQRGTRVTLVVPMADQPAAAGTAAAAGDILPMTVRHRAQRCRVLIVDDHQIMREGLAGLLQVEPDIEVVGEAADGERAVAQVMALAPDVVIMDVNLGTGIDGIEATRRLLAVAPDTTVVGLSMHLDQEVAAAMHAAGAAAYVTKGGPPDDLLTAIRAHQRA
jgi:PAS domain S-box-containing protein